MEAVIALEPALLAPLRSQLDDCTVLDDGNGWLMFRVAGGEPCSVPRAYSPPAFRKREVGGPFPGPQGVYDLLIWMHDDGMLDAIELLMLENEELDCASLARWLRGETP